MKIIGSFLIIISSVISSYYYDKTLKDNIKNLGSLINLISRIRTKIEYYSISIDEILKDCKNENSWIDSVIKGEKYNTKFLDKNLINDIENFFMTIGKGYKKEQLSLCDYILKSLTKYLDSMKTEFSKKSKIYRTLSLFFGVGLVILLV